MSATIEYPAIAPEELASKLHCIFSMRYPSLLKEVQKERRTIELLWFVQAMSLQPGGLNAFAELIVKRFESQIGCSVLPLGKKQTFSKTESLEIWNKIPRYGGRGIFDSESKAWLLEAYSRLDHEGGLDEILDGAQIDRERAIKESDLPELSREVLIIGFAEIALFQLPRILTALCVDPSQTVNPKPWFLPNLVECLLTIMDEHAKGVASRIAQTAVTEKVFDALEFACSEKVMVRVEGDPRFGKTQSVRTWCEMHPGRGRLVTVPCSNTEHGLFKAVADALGIDYRLGVKAGEIRDKVEYVLKHSRLMIVMDEAHFLLPVRYSDTTSPARLNWVRTQIADKELGCALIITPQSFEAPFKQFLKKTKHRFDQFFGRTVLFSLPREISREDMIAVAKVHFPEIEGVLLKLIVGAALRSESYLKAVEHISKMARFIARKTGRDDISHEDVEQAINDILPSAQPVASPAMQQPCKVVEKSNRISRMREEHDTLETLIPA